MAVRIVRCENIDSSKNQVKNIKVGVRKEKEKKVKTHFRQILSWVFRLVFPLLGLGTSIMLTPPMTEEKLSEETVVSACKRNKTKNTKSVNNDIN